MTSKKPLVALILITLIGMTAAILMTRLHYDVAKRGFDERSYCHVSDLIDCDSAVASRYSEILTPFGRLLTSEIGLIYYVLILAGVLYAWFSSNPATLSFLFLSSILAVLQSIGMAYVSVAELGILCLMCLTTYVANLLLFLIFPKALRIRYRDIPGFVGRYVVSVFRKGTDTLRPRLLLHLSLTVVVFASGIVFFRGLNPAIHKVQAGISDEIYLKLFYAQTPHDINLAGRPTWGNPDAKITIVTFSDFQCPFCRREAFTVKPYLKEFEKNVRVVFANYPLDSSCNPVLKQPMHPVSCMAAKAAICAHRQNRFWEMHDLIFTNQKKLSPTLIERLSGEVGLDQNTFQACLASEDTATYLKEDVDAGNALEVHGTPSVFLNGRPVRDWLNPERFRLLIRSELQQTLQQH